MGIGAQSFDQNNNLQFDSEMLTYFLRKSGTCNPMSSDVSNRMRVPGASSYPDAMVGFSGGNGHFVGFALNGAYAGSNYWEFITSAPSSTTFNYFIFDRSSSMPSAGFGLETYNPAGQITFSAAQRPLRTVKMLAYPDAPQSVSVPGKVLGFIPLAFAGYNRYDDAEEEGSYYHDYSVYAIGNNNPFNPNSSVAAVDVVEVPGGRGIVFGTRPPASNQFEVPGKFLVFNATNVPIGGPFF